MQQHKRSEEKQHERHVPFFTLRCSSSVSLKTPQILKHQLSKSATGSVVSELFLFLFISEMFFCSWKKKWMWLIFGRFILKKKSVALDSDSNITAIVSDTPAEHHQLCEKDPHFSIPNGKGVGWFERIWLWTKNLHVFGNTQHNYLLNWRAVLLRKTQFHNVLF